jgi:hypothetical protein
VHECSTYQFISFFINSHGHILDILSLRSILCFQAEFDESTLARTRSCKGEEAERKEEKGAFPL